MEHSNEQFDQRDPSMGHLRKSDAADKRALLNRMSRAIGHLESIKRMIEDDRDPAEVLIQLAAVRSAVSGVSRVILQEHIEECIQQAIDDSENDGDLENLNKIISYFIK